MVGNIGVPNPDVRSIHSDVVAFETFNDFFPKEYVEIFHRYNDTQTWSFDNYSRTLYTDLYDQFFEVDCVNYINEKLGIHHELHRCHRNGNLPISTNITQHYDDHHQGDRTLIWYGHREWYSDWGGETTFGSNDEFYVKAVPNSSVYFSSKHHMHNVRPVSIDAKTLRITYIWLLSSR